MKKVFLKSMLLLCALIVGSGDLWATEYSKLFSISAGDVVSGTSYKAHTATVSTRDYVITFGGNNSSVGTNSSNRSKCNLSSYNKYAVSPVTTSSVASAFACTTSISNVSKISYTFSGGSNQTNTKVYLLYSSDNSTFSKVSLTSGTQGATISSGTAYEFSELTGYFALLFEATNSSGNWRIDGVSIDFYQTAVSYTINPATNNSSYGTVSIEGNVITASPKSGYRVSTSTPYTVSSGTASVEQDNNEFTVSPTSDCTVTINFEAIPTYEVTINAVTGGTLSVMNGETPVSTGAKIQDGTVLTITATPDADYNFKNWQAIDASTHTYSASNSGTYTISGHAVTFNANFDAKVYHTASFSVNGEIVSSDDFEVGTAIDFPDDPSSISGKTFMGWSDNSIAGFTNEKPSLVSSANMGNIDITYYAVFAKKTEDLETATLTESEIKANFTNTAMSYGTAKTYNDTGDGITWKAQAYSDAASRPWFQLKKDAGSYLRITSSDNVVSVKLTISNTTNSSGGVTDISKHGNFSGTVYLSTAAADSPSGNRGSKTVNAKSVTVIATDDISDVYVQVSVGARVWEVEVVHGTITYSDYCTTVSTSGVLNNVNTANYGFATFCAPSNFTITPEDGKEVKAYKASLEGTTLTLSEINQEVIPASTGIILAGDKGASYTITYTPSDATAVTENDFEGTLVQTAYSDVNASGTKYVLVLNNTTNEFVRFTGNIPANKAYLLYDIPQQGSAPSVRIVFEGNNATSMEEIEATDEAVKFIENGILYIRRAGKTYDAVGRIVK